MKGNTINSDDVNLEFEKQKEITKLIAEELSTERIYNDYL